MTRNATLLPPGNIESRVLVCIAAHYVEARLRWLQQVLTAFAAYPCPVTVIIHTNEIGNDERVKINAIVPDGLSVELRVGQDMKHPFDLVWCHKNTILNDFLATRHTHFMYVEDDIVIDADAFAYWKKYRDILKPKGLVPGFVRVEQIDGTGPWYATDQFGSTRIDWLRTTKIGQWSFTNLDSPYVASLILDQTLAHEHAASLSFSEVTSRTVKPNWDRRERATLGITFENVPRFFHSRLVVPFDAKTLQVPGFAKVVHSAGNYAADPTSDLAKLPLTDLLKRQTLASQLGSIAERVRRKVWKSALIRKIRI